MSMEKKSPGAVAAASRADNQGTFANKSTSRVRTGKFWTKRRRVLLNLIRRPSLHRFQAERIGEHCLHSTVSAWQADGLQIARERISVPGWGGCPTSVANYFLTEDQRSVAVHQLATEMLSHGCAESRQEAVAFITSREKEAA